MEFDPTKISDELRKISAGVSEMLKKDAEKFAKEIQKILEKYLNETLKYPSFNNPQGRLPGFKNAIPKVKTEIIKDTYGGYKITAFAFMSTSGTESPHFIWHMINKGRADYTAKRTQIFPIRVAIRTFPNQYKVAKFPGWSGKWVTIPKGKTVKGYPARNFYNAIMKDVRLNISKKFPDYIEIKTDIDN